MNDSMREEFEAAFRSEGQFKAMSPVALDSMLERGSDGEYRSVRVHGTWWGWQASRTALMVPHFRGYSFEGCQYYDADAVDEAIENLSLKVKL